MSDSANRPALPPGLQLYYIGIGHYVSRALYLAAKLEVADQMRDGPRSAAELARATETDAPSLRRVLRLLASVGVFEEAADGRFALSPLGELLRSDVPGSMLASVRLFTGIEIQDSWKELEFCVRTGSPALHKHSPGEDPFAQMAADPARGELRQGDGDVRAADRGRGRRRLRLLAVPQSD